MSDSGEQSPESGPRDESKMPDGIAAIVDERTLLARQRTGASANRTVLANERTFSAWLRTALSAIGVGLAVPRLLAPPDYRVIATILGLILIVAGVAMGFLAACRYCNVAKDLEESGLELTPAWIATAIASAFAVVGVLSILLVVLR